MPERNIPILWEQATPVAGGVREIDPAQVHCASDVRVIDVREEDEFIGELGHAPSAELVPLRNLASAATSWEQDEVLVLVCRSGHRSAMAAQYLVRQGFSFVLNMSGGMIQWGAQGLPVSRS